MKLTFMELLALIVVIMFWIVLIGGITLWVVTLLKYGDTPVSELPAWAYFVLGGARK